MSEKTHQNGKGSKRRVAAKPNAYEEGYDAIDWSKDRPIPKPKNETDGIEWKIPTLDGFILEYSTMLELTRNLNIPTI